MTSSNHQPRRDGKPRRRLAGGRLLPQESGLLPTDFVQRLTALKEFSGLTWVAFSEALGQDDKQVRRWRNVGVEPSGGSMLALIRFARRFPGGLEILLGEEVDPETEEPDDDVEVEDEEDPETGS